MFGQLSGTIKVGATHSYTNIQSVCSDLEKQGISGPVTIAIEDGTYPESFTLAKINGNSADNLITFTSVSQDSAKVIIESNADTTVSIYSSHVAFSHIKVSNTGEYPALHCEDMNFIAISACSFVAENDTAVYAYSNSTPDDNNFGFEISHSTFSGKNGGIVINDRRSITNSSILNTKIDNEVAGCGLYIKTSGFNFSNITFDDLEINSYGNAIDIDAYIEAYNVNFINLNLYSATGYGVNLESYKFRAKNILFNNLTVKTEEESGLRIEAEEIVDSITITNCKLYSAGSGIQIIADNDLLSSILISDNYIESNAGDFYPNAIYLNTDYFARNITLSNCEIKAKTEASAVKFDVKLGLSDVLINNMDIENTYDRNGWPSALRLVVFDGPGENIQIKNSGLNSNVYTTLNLEFGSGAKNVIVDSCQLSLNGTDFTNEELFYFRCNSGYAENINVTNCMATYNADPDKVAGGFNFYGDGAQIKSSYFSNNEINTTGYGFNLDFGGGISDIAFNKLKIDAKNETAFLITGDDSGIIDGISIDSCEVNSELGNALEILTKRQYLKNVDIKNSNFKVSHLSSNYGIHIRSYYNLVSNVNLTNNTSQAYYGAYVKSENGGSSNVVIDGNNFYSNHCGIHFMNVSDGVWIRNNNIYANNDSKSLEGIYLISHSGGNSIPVIIENNTLHNIATNGRGISTNKINGLHVSGNKITFQNDASVKEYSGIGIMVGYCDDLIIEKNKLFADSVSKGIKINTSYFTATPGEVKNNTVTGFQTPVDLFKVSNANVYHNSTYTDSLVSGEKLISLVAVNKLNIRNNIFKAHSTNDYLIFETDQVYNGLKISHNTYDMNGTYTFFKDNFDNTEAVTLENFQSLGFGENAFITEVSYVNNDTDLHLNCSTDNLNRGMDGLVTEDLDGGQRPGSNPTNGAHELNAPMTGLFDADSIAYCSVPVKLSSQNEAYTYAWSTGENSASVIINEAGKYHLTASDYCGNSISDTILIFQPDALPQQAFSADSALLCSEPVELSTNVIAARYLWGSGEETNSIKTEKTGMHYLTLTNYCDNELKDSIIVYQYVTKAEFEPVLSDKTVFFTNSSTGATGYLWDFGDGNTSSFANPVNIYSGSGSYEISLTAYGECSDDVASKTIKIITSGLEETKNLTIKTYPNPVTEQLTIVSDASSFSGAMTYKLWDTNGKLVAEKELTQSETKVDMRQMQTGVYFLKIIDGSNEVKLFRIIKN